MGFSLKVGIVGLPNVGKSTLFNALLKRQVANVANYPFCTIEPNVGVIEVPDKRLPVLAKIVNTQTIVPAAIEFYDIAGLVKGASTGEGLGNKFLSYIREVSVIVHVVRLFEDSNIIHVANTINPESDIEVIESELILADLGTLSKQAEIRMNATKEEKATRAAIDFLIPLLNKGTPVRRVGLTEDQKQSIKHLNLLTSKPVIIAFNVSEKQLEEKDLTEKRASEYLRNVGESSHFLLFCAKLETEVLALSQEEQVEYLKQYNLTETGLDRLIRTAYHTLSLISFLTAGEKEVRAWTIKKGTLAPLAAGVIHTDFEKNFIKADIISYDIFINVGGWINAREQGVVQTVGRDYEMRDGDVAEFKTSA
ncbi:redox-regulated ATPase YchF [Candidatus Gottesmanbacteria bacterium]|nr:redox-regulated ATPase YchF [Candidatus Gottesmanbacteria bacterium]